MMKERRGKGSNHLCSCFNGVLSQHSLINQSHFPAYKRREWACRGQAGEKADKGEIETVRMEKTFRSADQTKRTQGNKKTRKFSMGHPKTLNLKRMARVDLGDVFLNNEGESNLFDEEVWICVRIPIQKCRGSQR